MATAPSLVQDLQVRDVAEIRTPCSVTLMRQSMDDESGAALDNAFEMIVKDTGVGRAKVYSFSWLSGVLKKHGYSISASTLARHAGKKCGCD